MQAAVEAMGGLGAIISSNRSPGDESKVRQTVASQCIVSGEGTRTSMARQTATFSIEARDAAGMRQSAGGDRFVVEVRGSSKVRAKVSDKEDGMYEVEYKPSTSGSYSISVTLNGVSLPGSPFKMETLTPAPEPSKCVIKGDALTAARAREMQTFEVEFYDALGQSARAEELDVWVEKTTAGGGANGGMSAAATGSSGEETSFLGSLLGGDGDGGAPAASADADGKPAHKLLSWEALKRSGGKVEVGSKPLIMRAEASLDAPIVSLLKPGQLVSVLERGVDAGEGKIRAKVVPVEEEEAARAIAESWWAPPEAKTFVEAEEMAEMEQLGIFTNSPRGSARSNFSPGRSGGRAGAAATSPDPSGGGMPFWASPQTPPAASAAFAAETPYTPHSITTSRDGLSPGRRIPARHAHGWVTILKDGYELVAQRPRLNAGERRKHLELCARREATDKALKKHMEHKSTAIDKKSAGLSSVGPSLAYEITTDPQGIAFAYGGIHPGVLHAGGKLVRTHTVRYSIGAAGHYKLHVGLRTQALPLPGSPFALYVAPSGAHAPSTSLPADVISNVRPLTGVVGDAWTCSVELHASDKMGNPCVTGGAPIIVDVDSDHLESQVSDKGDGSYILEWRGTVSGAYKTQMRIDGVHIVGSPTQIRMFPGPPDVPKCEISGGGLKTALAGQAATVQIVCKDRFGNPLNGDSLKDNGQALLFGLALLPIGEGKLTRDTCESMAFEGSWVKFEDGEAFEILYTAKEAGDFELHVWCDPDESDSEASGTRQWLTGSPFTIRVSGVRPDRLGSFVERPAEEDMQLIAGDTLALRPQLRDQFGNASAALEGSFVAQIDAPDGSHDLELKQLKGLGLYEVSYDVQIKGEHLVHFLLNGADISGSPVGFFVSPGVALGSKSRVYPPTEPPRINEPCELHVESIDKYGNKLDRGGSRVDARANGPGVSACTAEDLGDGSYVITFTAAVVGETRVIVRLDNIEMAPLKLVFVSGEGGDAGGKKGGRGAAVAAGGKPGGDAPPPTADAPAAEAPAPTAEAESIE